MNRARALFTMSRISFQVDPLRATVSTLLNIVGALTRPAFALLLGALGNRVGDGADGGEIALFGILLGLCAGVSIVLTEISWKLTDRVQELAMHHIDLQMLDAVMGVSGVEHHERPEYLDKLERLRSEYWMMSQTTASLLAGLQIAVQVIISAVVLGGISPWLLLLPVFSVPQLYANSRAERHRMRGLEAVQSEWRKSDDAIDFAVDTGPAKEVRVFGLARELLRRHEESSRKSYQREFGDSLHGAWWVAAGRLIFSIGFIGSIGFVAALAIEGSATPGDLLTTIALAGSILAMMTMASQQIAWLDWSLTAVQRYLWLIDYGKEHRNRAIEASPQRLQTGIRFEDVTFAYPDTERNVLEHLDLFLPAGATVAVIGDNGAGKSTLIKLLTRMYEPTSGRITVDDQPLSNIDIGDWREQLSGAFQDHARLELIAQESVGVGALPQSADRDLVDSAVVRGGALDVVQRLENGLDTQLGATWDGGVDLSGGQWQKLALARAMMRNPMLLVLDEPTSALDAETEHSLFERFADAAKTRSSEEGTITILVSHRFSTVRMADVIIVLSAGRVAEVGSHRELIDKAGLYAELYELQARAYR